jgi:AsmA-like C-terminal region
MVPVTAPPPSTLARPQQRWQGNHKKVVLPVTLLGCVLLCAGAIGLHRYWPYSQSEVLQDLREASDSQVQVQRFHETFFPSPGCILEGLVFHHNPSAAKPLITIEKLTIQGSYLGLLAQRVSRISAEGLVVTIPPFGTGKALHTSQSKISIAEIVANGSVLEFLSKDPDKKPLRFDIHEAILGNVEWKSPLTYRVKVHNPEPPGEVTAGGKFGVWNLTDPGETPISGKYKFEQADLSVYEGIAGQLSSTGQFEGKLAHIDISGDTDTPDFLVKSSGHPVRLTTKFSAYVDAMHGDTYLKQVEGNFLKTYIAARGSVATSANGKGKTALIDLDSRNARIEDLLLLFVQAKRAPMSGDVAFQAHAELPPGEQKFLKKIKLRGNFGIGGGSFAEASTQKGVDELSAGALGEKNISKQIQKDDKTKNGKNDEKDQPDPETVMTDLQGQVNVVHGTANFSDLSFRVPGAHARVHGTYNLMNDKIDLRGQMRVNSEISSTTTGAKSFLLKVMNPFFKKKPKGEVVPVRIGGDYEHPTFGLDLDDKKAQNILHTHEPPNPAPSSQKPE